MQRFDLPRLARSAIFLQRRGALCLGSKKPGRPSPAGIDLQQSPLVGWTPRVTQAHSTLHFRGEQTTTIMLREAY